jgi:hypothetical protein
MKQLFTKTFFKFFFVFLLILGGAFGVLFFTASQVPVHPVDNVALPQ